MSLSSDLVYLRSNSNQQFCLDAINENIPCSIDSLPTLKVHKETILVGTELKVDFIKELSFEISNKILGTLDTKSLSCAACVSKKWKIMCEYELKQRRVQCNNAKTEGTDAYYYDQLYKLLMRNIEKTYGEPFPF